MAVFGVPRRGGAVPARMTAGGGPATLAPVARREVAPASVAGSDSSGGCHTLSVAGYAHAPGNPDAERVADGRRHINGAENVWTQAERPVRRLTGVPKASLPPLLRDGVWRFDGGTPRELRGTPRELPRRRMTSQDCP